MDIQNNNDIEIFKALALVCTGLIAGEIISINIYGQPSMRYIKKPQDQLKIYFTIKMRGFLVTFTLSMIAIYLIN